MAKRTRSNLGRWAAGTMLLWTSMVGGSLWWNVIVRQEQTLDLARSEAIANFNKDVAYRFWATKHGGVYVPVTEQTPPSPYMAHIPERDVTTQSGRELTLMNPAYMLRQMMQDYEALYGVKGRIISFNPLRSENEPDAWEAGALTALQAGEDEVIDLSRIEGGEYLRLLRPFATEDGCLKCHAHQGYKVGHVDGAVGISLPMASYRQAEKQQILLFWASHGGLWIMGLMGLIFAFHRLRHVEHRMAEDSERFRRMFDQSPDPAWIIEGARFIECNSAAASMIGARDKSSLLRTHPADLSPEFQPDGTSSRQKAEQMIQVAKESGLHRFEWVHTRADGTQFDAEVTLSPFMLDGREVIYCTWRDITERKRAEAGLQLAGTVFSNSSEGILVTDADAVILSVNPAFTEITGYSAAEALGRKPNMLRSDHHDPAFYENLWRDLQENGRWQGEVWNRRRDGSAYIQWQTITAVRNANGDVGRYVSVFTDVTDMRRNEDRIRHLAFHDPLTGLPNRALLMDRLDHGIAVAKRQGHNLAIMFLDLDHFKSVNDTLGHDFGDRLLKDTAARIQSAIRASDTVARMGGDEFVVLFDPAGTAEVIARTAEKIIASLDMPIDLGGETVRITTSVGISIFPDNGDTPVALLKQADTAMYAAKAEGRNTYRFFNDEMTERTLARLRLERDLRDAIQSGGLELHYQPKVCFQGLRPCGVEALVRWRLADGRLIAPTEFIPIAEETGLIIPLGDWVIDEACRQIAQWRAAGWGGIPVAVNVSTKQLFTGDFVAKITSSVERHGIRTHDLQIEITESSVMADPEDAAIILSNLRALGVTIAIDDFGTGYSSLAYLTRLPIDVIKIDRSFVSGLAVGSESGEIISSIVGLGRSLGMTVIAEGVETEADLLMLTKAACPVGQGYLFARPMPADDLIPWLRARTNCRNCDEAENCGPAQPGLEVENLACKF